MPFISHCFERLNLFGSTLLLKFLYLFLCKNHFPVRKLRQKVTSDKGFGVFEKTGYKQTVVDDTDSSFMFVFRKVVEDFDDNEQNI